MTKATLKTVMRTFGFVCLTLIVCLPLIVSGCAPKVTETPEYFYKGSTIELVVPNPAGSGPDNLARILQPKLAELTGATVTIVNKPAGGTLEGHNYVWNAKPDGLTIGLSTYSALMMSDLLDDPGALFDIGKFGYLACVGYDEATVFWVKDTGPYKTVADLQAAKGLKFVAPARGQSQTLRLCEISNFLNLDATVATGFSSGESQLAVVQGQSAGFTATPASYLNAKSQGWRALFVLEDKRVESLPDVPAIGELVKLTKENQAILDLGCQVRGGRIIFMTPGVPQDRLSFMQGVFEQMLKDTAIRAAMDKLFNRPITDCAYGKEVTSWAISLKNSEKTFQDMFNSIQDKYCR